MPSRPTARAPDLATGVARTAGSEMFAIAADSAVRDSRWRVMLSVFVLERDLHLRPICLHDTAFDLKIKLGDLSDPQVSQTRRGLLDGGGRGPLPRLGARSDQLDDLVHALRHSRLLRVDRLYPSRGLGRRQSTTPVRVPLSRALGR